MKTILSWSFALAGLLALLSCVPLESSPPSETAVRWAGVRCSTYGIKPFPSPQEWDQAGQQMEALYPGSVGTFVWIVGSVNGSPGNQNCLLNFPLGEAVPGAVGFPLDENEAFLRLADERGYDVWLQVEPGDADLVALAGATMKRYRSHPSVKGFGVDVEWYRTKDTDGRGTRVSDALAQGLVDRVRSINPNYGVFLKHWDPLWMPPTARDGLVFVDDSQGHESLESMRAEFQAWATAFRPSPVLFQIGYESDQDLWGSYPNPVQDLGNFLTEGLPAGQSVGIVWVDFTLRGVMGDLRPRP